MSSKSNPKNEHKYLSCAADLVDSIRTSLGLRDSSKDPTNFWGKFTGNGKMFETFSVDVILLPGQEDRGQDSQFVFLLLSQTIRAQVDNFFVQSPNVDVFLWQGKKAAASKDEE